MRRSPEAWGWPKTLVTALFAVVGAGTTIVFAILGQPAPAAIALVAAVGALATVAFELPVGAARKRQADAEEARQVRVEVEPVDRINPTHIGVAPAAKEALGLDTEVPEYLRRNADKELDDALREALDGSGKWIVVVYGPATVGKSRTLFEGLRRLSSGRKKLRLVAPTDGKALHNLLGQVKVRRAAWWRRTRHVVWLDNLEDFLADEVGLKELEPWGRRGAIVVATYGGKAGGRDSDEESERWLALAENVMAHARQVDLQATTASEVRDLPASLSAVDREAIAEYGLAAALVAAPALEMKLKSRQGGERSAAGAAIVYAAIDWARCGRTDPIPRETLRGLWPDYLKKVKAPNTDEAFEAGLGWALEPVAGSISLLIEGVDDDFRADDYIRSSVTEDPDTARIPEATWRGALDTEDPAQAFAVGSAAHAAGRMGDAERALAFASSTDGSEVAAAASYNLGLLRQEAGDSSGAEEAFDRAREMGDPAMVQRLRGRAVEETIEEIEGLDEDTRSAIEADLRAEYGDGEDVRFIWGEERYHDEVERGNGWAARELGVAAFGREEHRAAEQHFRKAIELGYRPATYDLGVALEKLGDVGGAEAAYLEGMEDDIPDAAFNLGLLRHEKGDLPGSEEALRKASRLGHGVASSNLGILLGEKGDVPGSEAAFRLGMERGVPEAIWNLADLLRRENRLEEAEECFRRPELQAHPGAPARLARIFLEQGELEKAREALRPVAAKTGVDEELLLAMLLAEEGDPRAEASYRDAMEREVPLAATGLARWLETQGRLKEAEEAFVVAEEREEVMRVDEDEDEDEAEWG